MAIFGHLLAAIPAYTGLSPVSFFTIAALSMTAYYVVSGFFAAPKYPSRYVPMEPLPPPVQLGEITDEELREYDGTDPKKPLLMAIKGTIFDVSQSRVFYGPGGPYALFAGKDASRALAKMSFEDQDLNGNLEGLSAYEMDALRDWEWKFESKYVKVGNLKNINLTARETSVQENVTGDAKPIDETKDDSNEGEARLTDEAMVHPVEVNADARNGEADGGVDDTKLSADALEKE